MPAPKGNQFWKQRSTHGRNPIFSSPDQIWDAANQYFTWVEEHPLFEAKAFAFQGVVTTEPLPKMRAMTISGLCIYLDISTDTWDLYKKRKDFIGITTRVEEIIRDQKFSGAAADLLNANIIARDLGLKDESKREITGKDGKDLSINLIVSEGTKGLIDSITGEDDDKTAQPE